MYNVPWQNGQVFQTPVGVLTASFVLRPNTMFHPEGEWSVRLILPPLLAYRLRQLVAPAYDDVVARAKELYLQLPLEQQARRAFKENSFWQQAATEGGLETENIYFTFRLPAIDRSASTTTTEPSAPSGDRGIAGVIENAITQDQQTASGDTAPAKRKRKSSAAAASARSKSARLKADEAPAAADQADRMAAGQSVGQADGANVADMTVAGASGLSLVPPGGVKPRSLVSRQTELNHAALNHTALNHTVLKHTGHQQPGQLREPERVREVVTRIPLIDGRGEEMSHLTMEPDGWDAAVSFSIQQYWLRTFGAGVILRLHSVQLFGQHQRQADIHDELDVPISIAL